MEELIGVCDHAVIDMRLTMQVAVTLDKCSGYFSGMDASRLLDLGCLIQRVAESGGIYVSSVGVN